MVFKKFQIVIIGYLLLLLAGTFGIVYFSYIELNFIRLFFLMLYEVLILWAMIHYINRANRDTTFFLNAILHNDFTVKYSESKKGKTFADLYRAFNQVNQKFIDSTQSEASEYRYIITLIEQMQIGVVIYDSEQRIHLVNQAFKDILGKAEIVHLDTLKQLNSNLFEGIVGLASGEKTMIKTELENVIHQFSLAASEMKLRNNRYTIVSVQDIKNELDANEMEAWQKLIRVLTHEIMNSVSPITSLSGTLGQIVKAQPEQLQKDDLSTLKDGLDAIENRSKGLLSFTEAYRKLTKIPLIKLAPIESREFFERIASIFTANLKESIKFKMKVSPDFTFTADQHLLEQVIINLLKNASEAIDKQGVITLTSKQDSNHTFIHISDNGSGISDEVKDKIFVPFYTTKVEGSGIGLSLSRQIIKNHNGALSFETSPEGTTFKIEL